MDYVRLFQFIQGIFYFCGMCPISLKSSSVDTKKATDFRNLLFVIWSFVNLAWLAALMIVVFTTQSEFFGQHNNIGQFNDLIKCVTIFITHLTIILEALATRKHLFNFWKKIEDLDGKLFTQLEVVRIHNKGLFDKKFTRKFAVNLLCVLVIEFIVIGSIQNDILWSRIWYISIVSLTITRLRHLHLMLHVDMICYRLKILRKELKQVVSRTQTDQISLKEEAIEKRLFHRVRIMKNVYNILYECCTHLNFSFGFSQLANLMQNFIQLTCDLYWIYSVLYRDDLTYIFVLILVLVPTFSVVIVMLSSCEKCLREVREIGYLLHNIEKDTSDHSMDTLIENFSLQILHEPFFFSVTGFFNMDFTLLKAMVAAITTYMVIFIQFMPKEEAKTTLAPLLNISTTATTPIDI